MSDTKKPNDVQDLPTPVVTPNYEEKIAALEKKLGEFSSVLAEQSDYIQGTGIVLDTIARTPDLKQDFQTAYKGLYGEGSGQQSQQVPTPPQAPTNQPSQTAQLDRKVNDISSSQRESIILGFEKEYGISNLKDEERKEARKKVESYLNDFGASVQTLPLTVLRSSLDKAYVGSHAEKLREEGKLEGFAQARSISNGVIGNVSGGAPSPDESKKVLNDKQVEWGKKLHVDVDKMKKTVATDDQERVPSAEKTQ
jgi:hypothetical protein